jgi:hypothetical protein
LKVVSVIYYNVILLLPASSGCFKFSITTSTDDIATGYCFVGFSLFCSVTVPIFIKCDFLGDAGSLSSNLLKRGVVSLLLTTG